MLAAASADTVTQNSAGYWTVPGAGSFSSTMSLNFAQSSSLNGSLYIATQTIANSSATLYSRAFSASNVVFNAGDSVSLICRGSSDNYTSLKRVIPSGELITNFTDILYGSVRTVAKLSNVPGTCQAPGFFYANDTQETDIEMPSFDPTNVYFNTQSTGPGAKAGQAKIALPSDAWTNWHEYRMDWLPGTVKYYIDGALVATLNTSVPSVPGSWRWNNWSNGSPTWSGLPGNSSIDMRIQSITAYWNRTSAVAAMAASASAAAATASATPINVNAPCAPQPTSYAYHSNDGTNALFSFLNDGIYSGLSTGASAPQGYKQTFSNLFASINNPSYMTFQYQPSYNVSSCAAACTAMPGCQAFNIFAERNPSLMPAVGCDNPSSITNIKCTFFAQPIAYTDAINWGEWRQNFGVVIAGSNAYVVS